MKKITLLILTLFLSFSGYSQLLENFETAPAAPVSGVWTLGSGTWNIFDNGVGSANWGLNTNQTSFPANSVPNAAFINRQNIGQGNSSADYLATPLVLLPANPQLRFYTRTAVAGNQGTVYEVRAAAATSDPALAASYTTLLQTYTEDELSATYNVYEEKVITLPTTLGTSIYIAFVKKFTQPALALSGDVWLVDDIKVIPKCLDPINLAATALSTTANLSWGNPSGATSWQVHVLPMATVFSPTVGTPILVTPTPAVTVNSTTQPTAVGLAPLTQYKYYVRAMCTNSPSDWAGPFSFTTQAAPPECGGNFVDAGGTTANYPNSSDSTVTICPVNPGDLVTVTFTAFDTETNWDALYVFDGNSITAPQIASANGAGNVPGGLAGGYWGTVIPGPFTSSSVDGCLTFRFRSDGSVNRAGWLSNVTCNPPPACPKPTALTTGTITTTTVSLGWTNVGPATSWEVIAVPCGSPAPTGATVGTPAPTNPFVLTGLNSATCYDFYVRGICASPDISEWAGPKPFTTLIAPPVCGGNFVDEGGPANYPNNSDSTVVICPVNPGDVVTVTFTSFNTQASNDGLYVFNGNSITAPQISSGNPAGTVPGGLAGSYWGTVNPGSFTSSSVDGCLTFRFRSGAATNAAGWVSNITCAPAPVCPAPYSLLTSTVTATSVNLAWTNGGTETAWEVIALPCGSPAPTATSVGTPASTNPFVLSGLNSETCYVVYVRAVCSATESSTWTGPQTFTTQIAPPVCGGTFVDAGGVSANYPNGSDSTVTICPVIPGEQVTVTFTSFDTETNWDALYVFDGNSIAATQIASTNGAGNVPGGLAGGYWGTAIPGPFTSSSVDGCLTFRFRSDGSVNRPGWVANVTCLPPPTCPKPTAIVVSAIGQTNATIAWTEVGSATSWQVLVLPANAPIPTATTTGWVTANTNPFLYPGLASGTSYKVYVRAFCSASDISFWSNPASFSTLIQNDECINAIVVPVNPDTNCAQTVGGTVVGATASSQPNTCAGTDDDDVWFQFTATTTSHYITFNAITGSTTDLFHVLYSGSCGALTQIYCSDPNQSTANGLVPGETYYIRVYTYTANANQTTAFTLCIGTIPPPITTNVTQFTNSQLIEDVLLNSTCANVSNVTSSTGSNFGSTNGIGYFNKNGSSFPFEEGIVLTTGNALSAPGPNTTNLSEGNAAWTGDAQLEAIILAATGAPMNSRNASKLEFDFVPLTNNISFNFIFASEEYGTFQCSYSDAFAFLLTDITTGITTNLAIIPGTTTPISVVTVRDQLYNGGCASVNATYFDAFYQLPAGLDPLAAPINYNGVTVPLTATSPVTPGNQYHIKLVIADRSDNSYDSAVFLEGGSFDIGNVELGADFLQANGTALCSGESYTIESGLNPIDYTFSWTQDGNVIPNETNPDLTVNQTGTYAVNAQFINSTCFATDSITIEFYGIIANGTPNNLTACNNLGYAEFDLSQNDSVTLGLLNPSDFTLAYYASNDDALAETNALSLLYTNTIQNVQTIFVRVENIATGCFVITQFDITVQDLTPQFTITSDFSICEGTSGTISVTPINYISQDVTYSWTFNGNPLTDSTSSITVALQGAYEVVVDNSGCTSNAITNVLVTPIPVADAPADVVECGSYTLPALTIGNYYSVSNGVGTMLNAGDDITSSQTIFVFAQSGTTPNCTSENSFNITITPMLTAIFDPIADICQGGATPILPTTSTNGVTGTWSPSTVNTAVSGMVTHIFTPDTTVCIAGTAMDITIHPTPIVAALANVSSCDTYTLPALSVGNYFTGSNGTGTALFSGNSITTTQTLYVYAQSGTTPNCTDEESFEVTITSSPEFAITGGCVANVYVLEASVLNNSYDPSNVTYSWSTIDGEIVANGTTSAATVSGIGTYTLTVTTTGVNCFGSEVASVSTSTTCVIQKGISPNGDGMNDFFNLEGFNVTQLEIFNRYGTKVYSRTNYTNQWQGQSDKGDELPDGTYYFVIERSDVATKTGWIYINRAN